MKRKFDEKDFTFNKEHNDKFVEAWVDLLTSPDLGQFLREIAEAGTDDEDAEHILELQEDISEKMTLIAELGTSPNPYVRDLAIDKLFDIEDRFEGLRKVVIKAILDRMKDESKQELQENSK